MKFIYYVKFDLKELVSSSESKVNNLFCVILSISHTTRLSLGPKRHNTPCMDAFHLTRAWEEANKEMNEVVIDGVLCKLSRYTEYTNASMQNS